MFFLHIIQIVSGLCLSFSYAEYINLWDYNSFHGNQPSYKRFRMCELNDRWIGIENVSGVQKEMIV